MRCCIWYGRDKRRHGQINVLDGPGARMLLVPHKRPVPPTLSAMCPDVYLAPALLCGNVIHSETRFWHSDHLRVSASRSDSKAESTLKPVLKEFFGHLGAVQQAVPTASPFKGAAYVQTQHTQQDQYLFGGVFVAAWWIHTQLEVCWVHPAKTIAVRYMYHPDRCFYYFVQHIYINEARLNNRNSCQYTAAQFNSTTNCNLKSDESSWINSSLKHYSLL